MPKQRRETISVHTRLPIEHLAWARHICIEQGLSQTLTHADLVRSVFYAGLQIFEPRIFAQNPPPADLEAIRRRIESSFAEPSFTGTMSPASQPELAEPDLSELAPADQALAQEIWTNASQRPAPQAELLRHLAWLHEQPAGQERAQAERITTWLLEQEDAS